MRKYIEIKTLRSHYSAGDCFGSTLTVGELINVLSQLDADKPVVLSFDNGYTYGGITDSDVDEEYTDED